MSPAEMVDRLHHKLHRRVRDLTVEVSDGKVTLAGSSPSFYLKQLAQEEIRLLLQGRRIINRITVL